MESPMTGIVLLVLVLLLSRPCGWSTLGARVWFGLAAGLFTMGILSTAVAVSEGDKDWLLARTVMTAIGALLAFLGTLQLAPLDRPSDPRSTVIAQLKRKGKKARHAHVDAESQPDDLEEPDDDA